MAGGGPVSHEPEHVVVRLSNSQIALLAAAVSCQSNSDSFIMRRAEWFERWLRNQQAGHEEATDG